jgi:RNA polymerase sigma-70 factor (ECF subfamily)
MEATKLEGMKVSKPNLRNVPDVPDVPDVPNLPEAPDCGRASDSRRSRQAAVAPGQGVEVLTAATIRRAQHGEAWALAQILRSVRPRIVALAVRMVRDPDEAEDVVQDALTKLWRNLHKYEARSAFSTWLHRIVVNTALDHLRARRNGVVVTRVRPRGQADGVDHDVEEPQKVDDTTPEELLARAQLGHLVRGAMDDLSPAHREILIWRELDGESYQDIARLARCPVGTVMSRLHHARHKLAETLSVSAADLMSRAA